MRGQNTEKQEVDSLSDLIVVAPNLTKLHAWNVTTFVTPQLVLKKG